MLAYDQRWHGDSAKTCGGSRSGGSGSGSGEADADDPGACHVARLAVDLEGVLDAVLGGGEGSDSSALQQQRVTCVGTSLGAAVLWSHYELFRGGRKASGKKDEGEEATASKTSPPPPPRIHRVVYVDQAPLQNRTPDWTLGSKGCYDAETLAGLQAAVRAEVDPEDADDEKRNAFARGNAEACLAMPIPAELDALLAAETNKASREALARLMADHTQGDWRAVVRGLEGQEALVVAGSESKVIMRKGEKKARSEERSALFSPFRSVPFLLLLPLLLLLR